MIPSDFMIHGVLNGFDDLVWSCNLIKSFTYHAVIVVKYW